MCGRFTLIRLADFTDVFPWILPPDGPQPTPRYNIAPTQPIAAVPNTPEHRIDHFYWGLVPHWAKDVSIGAKMINARSETAAVKPAFRHSLRRRRCVVPASGFYEWKKLNDGRKQPVYITLRTGRPMALGGLWDIWQDDKGNELRSCTILTTAPNEMLSTIHDRMPLILDEQDVARWLDPAERQPEELADLLRPAPAEALEATPVARLVSNPRNDSPQCIEPLVAEPPDAQPEPRPTRRRRAKPDDGQGTLF